ncbi:MULTISPECIES: LacI family DNA-binding transcriptional regulator [Sphingobacterium]|uniref:LacI family DNA-binding transcriptional regulator n=1 Tax=Sphingobacterium TaxID=28453 RepID=UPI00257E6695|nr:MULTISPECIES: LacI family DNA-binding transcriptional regulator [Sphingobacterium]
MKNRETINIKYIAELLKISTSTVSRAFRNTHDINPATKDRVLNLANSLNYKPNPSASALASGSTKTIGVIIPSVQNFYFSTVISGIQSKAFAEGYNVILYISNDHPDDEARLLENLSLGHIDGLLISISSEKNIPYFERLIELKFPLVFFDRVPHIIQATKVMQDDFQGAYDATKFLIDKGYQSIAHISGPKEMALVQSRYAGFKQAMQDHRLDIDSELIVFSAFNRQSGFDDTNKILASTNKPDAIFAVNDSKAIGSILALKKKNIVVGSEIGVIGFTNDPIGEIIEPALTTIEEPAFQIGQESCHLLLRHIKHTDFEVRDLILPNKLIIRSSTKTE